jgi:hypothetical protein
MSGQPRPHRAALVAASLAIALSGNACGGSSDDGVTPSSSTPSSSTPSSAGAVTSSPVGGSETTPVDGVYVVTITDADAAGAGIPKHSFADLVGDYQLEMVRGQIRLSRNHGITLEVLRGSYAVDGNAVVFSGQETPALAFDWQLDHGELRLTLTDTDRAEERAVDELIFTTHTWERRA